jgi:alkenylglycerophosphocholine/alkenylglycerophosphoethanolamine hydrolase
MMRQAITVYIILAAVFILSRYSFAMPIPALLKILPLLLLLLWVWFRVTSFRPLLLLALAFGMGGDIAMAFDGFLAGLGLFLIGHIFYTVLWCQQLDFSRAGRVVPLLLLMAFGAYWLLPHTGEMSAYVAIYFSVITLMAAAASLSRIVNVLGLLGVYSFLLSDFVIGWNRFVDPLAWSPEVIMITYYLAQLLMVVSVIQYQRYDRSVY